MITKTFTAYAARVVALPCLALAIAFASSCSVSTEKAFDAAWNGDAVTVARYLSSGGAANAVDAARNTLAHAGADINAENGIDRRKGPIHYAAMASALDAAALLLERGVDVNALCGLRATPATWAADRSTLETVKFFVARGADLTIMDINGDTALAAARATRKDDIVQYLHSIGVTR